MEKEEIIKLQVNVFVLLLFTSLSLLLIQDIEMVFWFILPLSCTLFFLRLTRIQIQTQFFFLLLFYILFGLRFVVLINRESEISLGRAVESIDNLQETFKLFSLGTFIIVIISTLLLRNSNISKQALSNFYHWLSSSSSAFVFYVFLSLSVFGFVIIFFQLGSLVAIYETFFFHHKQSFEGMYLLNLGLTLWSTFSVPALVIGFIRLALIPRIIHLLSLVLLLTPVIFLFGSRLSLFITIVASFFLLSFTNYQLKPRHAFIAISVFISASIPILARREIWSKQDDLLYIVADKLSYPVIDATTILYANPDSLKYHVFDTERILTIFGSLIPRILWRDKPYFGSSLLDNIMARTFGYQIQGEKSGWPTGFITEGLAIAGITGVIFSSITIGVVVFFLNQIQGFVLLNHPRHFFTVAYTCTFLLIAVYKDGDTISALIGSIKTFLWMFIIISGLEFIVRRRLS